MWDEYTPLQLLKTMPKKLNQENLSKIQMVIDADKYKNSLVSGFDLCGIYAPFCRGCDKTSIYPCAIAYIRMMQSDGMNIEIDASPEFNGAQKKYSEKTEIRKKTVTEIQQATAQREIKIGDYKSSRTLSAQEVKFSEPKVYKTKIKEAVKEIAVAEAEPEDEPVLILPEIKDADNKKFVSEEGDEANIFVPVKEAVTEPVKEAPPVNEEPQSALPPAPVKEEPAATGERGKRRIRIAVARRKL